jgi:uncharacterized RDD family membrane protein YckC
MGLKENTMEKHDDQMRYAIQSTELLFLDSELAGIGGRALAYNYDLLIRIAVSVAIFALYGFLFRSSRSVLFAVILLFSAFNFFYYIAFEVAFAGKSPGKYLTGIRVIKRDGTKISLLDSLVRNIMRLADMLPFGYMAGIAVMLFDPQNRRLGDILADTIVVYDRPKFRDLSAYLDSQLITAELKQGVVINGIERLGNRERAIIKDLCHRIDTLSGEEKERILEKVREKILSRIEITGTDDPEIMLYEVFKRL